MGHDNVERTLLFVSVLLCNISPYTYAILAARVCVVCNVFCAMINPNSPIYCKIQPAKGCMKKTFFRVGEIHMLLNQKPEIFRNGYHCCSNFLECFRYYRGEKGCKYFRVQLGTRVENNEELFCGDEIQVVEEWSHEKVMESITEEVYLAAVSKGSGWRVLEFVPENMKSHEVCLAAVTNDGNALRCVPETMKSDKVCLAAVANDINALKWVPENLKSDKICNIAKPSYK